MRSEELWLSFPKTLAEFTMRSEELWLSFPKTLAEFDERFPDEAACRAYLIELRWGNSSAGGSEPFTVR